MKVAMSGQKITCKNWVLSSFNIYKSYKKGIFGNVGDDIEFHNSLLQLFSKHISISINGSKILDIGCGQMAKQTALFAADGAIVSGIDIEMPSFKLNWKAIVTQLKINGLDRTLKSFIRHSLFDKKYISQLSKAYNKQIPFGNIDVRVMDVTNLQFPANYFDFIFSVAVFEHVDNIDKALSEINRVLKNNGVAYILIHLYPSLSGGHNLEWIYPDKTPSQRVPPWDHLLENKYAVNTFLNRLKLSNYRELFNQHVRIVDETLKEEGSKILTEDLLHKLQQKGYSRQDLLTRTVSFICKKK